MSRVAPYSPAETAEAASWLDYLAGASDGAGSPQDRADALSEAIDKAHRRGALSSGAAALLSEVFDVPGASPYALA